MDSHPITLRRADADDCASIERLLERNDLPSGDVREKRDRFYVAFDGRARVGVGGIEQFGTDGLLRSVVVTASARRAGYGSAICSALEDEARGRDIDALYLLTTTAADFFAGCGYETIDRGDAPAGIQQTAQFSELCPASATCMWKAL